MIYVLVLLFQETLSVCNCGGDGENKFLAKEKILVSWNIIELFFFGTDHYMMVMMMVRRNNTDVGIDQVESVVSRYPQVPSLVSP